MSVYPLVLAGWDELSTWGYDSQAGSLYAQLTRNENSDADGPDIWISPPRWPVLTVAESLAEAIAKATGVSLQDVYGSMAAGLDEEGRRLWSIPGTGMSTG